MKLLNPDYSYNCGMFKGSNGTWKLTGTDTRNIKHAKDVLDTFRNIETKEYITIQRHKIYQLQQEGKIMVI